MQFEYKNRLSINIWLIAVLLIAFLSASPILVVFSSFFSNEWDFWQHLTTTVLPRYLYNSISLMLGVSTLVVVIGVSAAWLVSMCRFPGRRLFEWALILPIAAPAYLLAYSYTDFLDFFGPVQTSLRSIFGWQSASDYWFPDTRSLWGAALMLGLVLYPYVYLLTRVAFLEQSTKMLEAGRSLGCNPWKSFLQVSLPLARPAITAGLALVLMETLNDFGTVEYFGVPTLSTGIYRTWLGAGNPAAAAQLSGVLMLFILVLITLEKRARSTAKYYQTHATSQNRHAYDLKGIRSIGAIIGCMTPILLGFLIPSGILLGMTLQDWNQSVNEEFWVLAKNSLLLAVLTAFLSTMLAIFLAYSLRIRATQPMELGVRVVSMGYAFPGTVIAVGILIPLAYFDNAVSHWMEQNFNMSTGLLISGTITALVFAYLIRFLAVSFNTVESGLVKIRPNLDEAAKSLGANLGSILTRVHIPLMRGSILTSIMLVFVDVMKELPATIVIRPFNFDTLAIRVYQYASDERLIEATAPALSIILVGLIPVFLLSWQISSSSRMDTL